MGSKRSDNQTAGDRSETDEPPIDEGTREQRIAEIKRHLDEGTYTIDLDLVAERLVDDEIAS